MQAGMKPIVRPHPNGRCLRRVDVETQIIAAVGTNYVGRIHRLEAVINMARPPAPNVLHEGSRSDLPRGPRPPGNRAFIGWMWGRCKFIRFSRSSQSRRDMDRAVSVLGGFKFSLA